MNVPKNIVEISEVIMQVSDVDRVSEKIIEKVPVAVQGLVQVSVDLLESSVPPPHIDKVSNKANYPIWLIRLFGNPYRKNSYHSTWFSTLLKY